MGLVGGWDWWVGGIGGWVGLGGWWCWGVGGVGGWVGLGVFEGGVKKIPLD